MSEACQETSCGGCDKECESRKPESFLEPANAHSRIKKVIGVVSGKGGVGKTMVTCLLAAQMQREGFQAAVLDADITGPSVPRAFGITEKAVADERGMLPAVTQTGIEVMSTNLLLEHDTDPVIWRGPVIAGVVKQFWHDVVWGEVDFMFVDMPPGTGDVPLTVFQSLPLNGIVVVASPQQLVGMIVEKAVNMAGAMHIPVLALVENMSAFKCPDCGAVHPLFGESHVEALAKKHGIPVVCRLPIDPQLAAAADAGTVELCTEAGLQPLADALAVMHQG